MDKEEKIVIYTYDGCCGSCIYMNTNDYVRHKDHCYCTYRKQYYNLKEHKCVYYRYDPNKDYYDLNHRWHVVSAVLLILGQSAENLGIEALHRFRVDVLEKDPRYEAALRVYDVIGPFLANQLLHDPNAVLLSSALLENRLKAISRRVEAGEYDEAIREYAGMIDSMAEHYYSQIKAYCELKKIQISSLRMEECV